MKPYARIPFVKVGPVQIPVLVNPKLDKQSHAIYNTYPITRVEIASGGGHDQIHRTLLHEALHAMDEMYHLKLGERGVTVLENVLAAFVVDNPVLVAGLTASYTPARGTSRPRPATRARPTGHSGGANRGPAAPKRTGEPDQNPDRRT